MDRTDIVRVQNDWARAARAARDIGFDLIYIFVGDSYLPMQFLSEFYNKRTDDYGGSFENRARFFSRRSPGCVRRSMAAALSRCVCRWRRSDLPD